MSAEEMKRKARAFVLIETEPGKEKEVMEKLLKFDQVKEVHIYSGDGPNCSVGNRARNNRAKLREGVRFRY